MLSRTIKYPLRCLKAGNRGDCRVLSGTMILSRTIATTLCIIIFWVSAAYTRNYVRSLVGNLLKIGYPISQKDVIALDKIAMRFDEWNRLDVLKKILGDRDKIHHIKGADYFDKTEALCDALRLLDEHNLPEANELISNLSRQGNWEKREKTLLSYMAAKRGIDYQPNVMYLMADLEQFGLSSDEENRVGVSIEILDFCSTLSYLSDIFSLTGDIKIGNALIDFASRGYGYPGEYASRLLVEMCLQQPEVYIPLLAGKNAQTRKTVIDAMVFGIWNNQQKENVLEVLNQSFQPRNHQEKTTISTLDEKIRRRFSPDSVNVKELKDNGHSDD